MIASPYARRTRRVSEIVGLLGHSAGGRPGERLMRRLGMPVSDDTILRQLKRDAALVSCDATIRVVGIDDWSWRRSWRYGTMIVDLERRAWRVRRDGWSGTLLSRSSAETDAGCTRKLLARVRRKRVKSLIGSISCRICGSQSRSR
ncbi:transposase IS204/IS1001/IS1096/IS1165 family protein [Sinorhizobium fredii USDA 257]|uniref:Transposase IS204/IS1001/IS1096/IS1165 family protein n=1 Tax=Sinorhizobium fredii (strain USDA 257) TaxID=1185652 RepID=I3X3R9_SINF2|nr:transposase IS204/IS1001/IS1096/IS1165 family protein [Sinorhizobium fredii USDA 257]